eukprot:428508-Amphidinium_carterae.2
MLRLSATAVGMNVSRQIGAVLERLVMSLAWSILPLLSSCDTCSVCVIKSCRIIGAHCGETTDPHIRLCRSKRIVSAIEVEVNDKRFER